MILSHVDFEEQVEISSQTISVLVVEDEEKYFEICNEIFLQCEGADGNFVLSENGKSLSFAKDVRFVADCFSLTFKDKKAQNALLATVCKLIEQKMLTEFSDLNQKVFGFLDKLNAESDFAIEYDLDVTAQALLKSYNVRWKEDDGAGLLDKLVSYVNFCSALLNTKLFVFVGLKNFLTEEQLRKFYHEMSLAEANVLLLENVCKRKLENEQIKVIDRDLCEIVV